MNYPDVPVSENWVHQLEQATGAFRQAAEMLAAFKKQLIKQGFTEEGAEALTDTFATAAFHD